MKRLIISTLAMLAVLVMAGTGIFAGYQRSEASLVGLLGDLTFDLKVRDQDECWGDGMTATWTAANMKPGDAFAFEHPGNFVNLSKLGLLPADHLELACSYSITEAARPGTGDTTPDAMARQMVLTELVYTKDCWSIDLLTGSGGSCVKPCGYQPGDWQVADIDADGSLTFYDLKYAPLDNLPPPRLGDWGRARVEMGVRFSEAAGNEFQGDALVLTMYFRLRSLGGH